MKKFKRRSVMKRLFALSSLLVPIYPSFSIISYAKSTLLKANMVVIWKNKRKMSLFRNKILLKTYPIRLGFNPIGHKQKEGDGRTPEGRYFITHHNPNSAFHKSLGISYPNSQDKKNAKKRLVFIQRILGNEIPLDKTNFFTEFNHPGILLEHKEQSETIYLAINTLPESQKTVFTLAKLDGKTYQEIVEITGKSMSSVESIMFRAKKNLQKKLANFYKNKE